MSEPDLWAAIGSRMDNPIVFGLVFVAGVYLFVSKRLAEITGTFAWVGKAARWWNDRQKRRVLQEAELWKVTHAADRARDSVRMEEMQAELDWVTGELRDMRRREQLRDAQARRHTQWDYAVVAKLQAARIPVDEPPPLYLDLAPLHVPEESP